MYVVAVSRLNANCVLVFQFIYKLIQLFRTYFRGRFNEANIRQHFVLVYELLDGLFCFFVVHSPSLPPTIVSPPDILSSCLLHVRLKSSHQPHQRRWTTVIHS